MPWSLVLYSAAMQALGSEVQAHSVSLHTTAPQKGPLFPQVRGLLTAWFVSCKVPGERRWRSRKRQAVAGESDAGGFWHFPATQANRSGIFQDLLPLPYSHQRKHTIAESPGAILPRPGSLHWDSTRIPCPRLVTFSKSHPFFTKLFAE